MKNQLVFILVFETYFHTHLLIEQHYYEKAREQVNKAFVLYNDEEKSAILHITSGNIYKYELKTEKAIIDYNLAIDIYKSMKNKEQELSLILNNIGLTLNQGRKYSEAVISYVNSIRYENKENHLGIAKIYVNMGSPLMYSDHFNCAIKTFNHAIELCENLEKKSDASKLCLKIAHSGLANCSYQQGESLDAIEHYKNSEEVLEGFENIYSRIYLGQKADLYQNMAATYHELNFTKEALKYYDLSFDIENSFKQVSPKIRDRNLAISYYNRGMLTLKEKENDSHALMLIGKAKKLIIDNDGFDLSPEVIKQMIDINV